MNLKRNGQLFDHKQVRCCCCLALVASFVSWFSTAAGGQDDVGFLRYVDPSRAIDSAKVASGFGPDRDIAKASFDEAEAIFLEATKLEGKQRKKRFMTAAGKYEKAAKRWPNSVIEEDSLFMMSESYFFADYYPKASESYAMLIKKYQNTRHLDTVDKRRFALAQYLVERHEIEPDCAVLPNLLAKDLRRFDKFGHGVRVLDKIRFDDPTGRLADDATMAAAVAFYKQKKFMRADELFTDLRRAFPNSEHQFQAHLLGVKCKLEVYQGSQYASTPMDEAEELVKQIHRQFPQESREHKEFLTEAWKKIRLNKAMDDWEMARYYDKRKAYAAARQYYDRVRRDYGDTSLAQEATDRIAVISERDPTPSQPLPWLAKMFPTPERKKPLVAIGALEKLRR